jgi:hypothetical protein
VAALERVPPFVFVIEFNYALAPLAPTSGTTTTFGRELFALGSIKSRRTPFIFTGLANRFLGRA